MRVVGIDIDKEALKEARASVCAQQFGSGTADFLEDDFLKYSVSALASGDQFDAVIGNPPFIRYQYLDSEHQRLTEKIFSDAGLNFTRHTNAWVPFVLQSLRMLRPKGRLGMVIPAEIMHVLHAGSLRTFLEENCSKIAVVHLEELFSETVLQGVVLLLCEKRSEDCTERCQIAFPSASNTDLVNGHVSQFIDSISYQPTRDAQHKWMEGLLTAEEQDVYDKAKSTKGVFRFSEVASVDVGIVTGANKFFLVTQAIIDQYELDEFAHPMFGRSSHVKGISIRSSDIENNEKSGLPTRFIHFPRERVEKLPKGAQSYIALGEELGLQERYKCRIRKPWYVVPSVWASDVSMLKRAHDVPRLILNEAKAYTTDTAYRIRMNKGFKRDACKLVGNFVNSLTALSAELEGRHYGGGVIELVPSEIERVLVPLSSCGRAEFTALDNLWRAGESVDQVIKQQDRRILSELGLSAKDQRILNKAMLRLRRRRQRA